MKGYHFDFASNCEVFMNEPFDLRVSMRAKIFLAATSAKFEREDMLKIFQSSSILLVRMVGADGIEPPIALIL